MICLTLDTSNGLCSVGIYDSQRRTMLAEISENLGRGHAERLIGAIDECFDVAAISPGNLSRVVSTAGPGSFTGVRVGLATARGLALGWGVPVVGISNLLVLEHAAVGSGKTDGSILTAIDANRGEMFVRYTPGKHDDLEIDGALMSLDSLLPELSGRDFKLCGSAAVMIAETMQQTGNKEISHTLSSPPILEVAKLGSLLSDKEYPPEPIYLRRPDAKVQTGFAVSLKS